MPKYQIEMTVNFSGEVEADTEDEAIEHFIDKRESMYYESLESFSVQDIEEYDNEGEGDNA